MYDEGSQGATHQPAIKATAISTDEHEWIVQAFEEAEEAGHDARKLMARDRDYYDNEQLTEEEIAILRKRGQPTTVENLIGPKVDFLIGMESQQRTDPKAFPRNPQDEDAAEAATDALRYVADKENLDQTFSSAWEDMIVPGFCAAEVNIKETKRGTEIWVEHHEWDHAFADPHSRKHDYTDARYLGIVKWMDQSEAIEQWPDKKSDIETMCSEESSHNDDFEDKPEWKTWVRHEKRKRIRVVQICWKVRSQWKWAIFCKGAVFVGGDVPFLDADGETECPLIFQSSYVDRHNNRYGTVRRLIGPQDEVNARRSKMLHLLHMRQTWGRAGVVDDVDEVKAQMAKPDGHVEMNGVFGEDWGVIDNTTQVQGQAELLQESKQAIDRTGANNALQGRGSENASGRAILASQQGGMIEIAKLTDRHRHFKNRIYRAVWNRIRQYWPEEKWIRVTDDQENIKFVGLNRTITMADKLIEDAEKQGMPKEQATEALKQRLQQNPEMEQELRQEVKLNVAADMDMDINVEEVPDVVSVQQEQFDELSKLLQSGIPLEDPRMKLLISASSLRDKGKLLEMIDGNKAPSPEQQKQSQMQEHAQQLQVQGIELANEKTRAEIAKIHADAQGQPPEQVDPEMDALAKDKARADIEKTRADGIKSLAQADAADGVIGNLMNPPQQPQQSATS